VPPHDKKNKPITVSAFQLDRYEITIGRFRAFAAELSSWRPAVGTGAHPRLAGSGWDPAWPLVNSAAEFSALIQQYNLSPAGEKLPCGWTDLPEADVVERLPMGCLTWYEAFAFCAWDEGHLPTSAEWFFAAAGGDEQRVYPWSVPPSSSSTDGVFPGLVYPGYLGEKAVGSFPASDARWGHADLLGNVSEMVLDSADVESLHFPCSDCASLGSGEKYGKITRDSGWDVPSFPADTATNDVHSRYPLRGARCARSPR
jgi:formylglycine-generating enzyme required for sulfatase activity